MTPPLPPEKISDFLDRMGPNLDLENMARLVQSGQIDKLPSDQQALVKNLMDEVQYRVTTGQKDKFAADAASRDRMVDAAMQSAFLPAGTAAAVGVMHAPAPGPGEAPPAPGTPPVAPATTGIEAVTQPLGAVQASQLAIWQQFGHDVSGGLLPKPDVSGLDLQSQAMHEAVIKPVTSVIAMGVQGMLVSGAFGMLSKLPAPAAFAGRLAMKAQEGVNASAEVSTAGALADAVGTMAARATPASLGDVANAVLSPRVQTLLKSSATWGVFGLSREEVPSDPYTIDITGQIAKRLDAWGIAHGRAANALGGLAEGVLWAEGPAAIARGIQAGRKTWTVARMSPETMEAMKKSLQDVAVAVPPNPTKTELYDLFQQNLGNIAMNKATAGLVAERLAREDHIVNQIYGDQKLTPMSEDARFMAALHQSNPSGIALATDITETKGATTVEQTIAKLGYKVDVAKVSAKSALTDASDVIMAQPKYGFSPASALPRNVQSTAGRFERFMQTQQGLDNEIFVLPTGNSVSGVSDLSELNRKLKLTEIQFTPDAELRAAGTLREATGSVHVSMNPTERVLNVTLPSQVTQEQVASLGRFVDNRYFTKLMLTDASGATQTFEQVNSNTLTAAVAAATKVQAESRLTSAVIETYKTKGILPGQAGITETGMPVRVIDRVPYLGVSTPEQLLQPRSYTYIAEDPMRPGTKIPIHESRLRLLPTTLEGQLQPSNLFMQYLSPEDQKSFAAVRRALFNGLGTPITNPKQLDNFAATVGLHVGRLKGGQYQLTSLLSGESVKVADLGSAIEYVRKYAPTMPDLTPMEVTQFLGGNNNLGLQMPIGTPPKFGEVIPLPNELDQLISNVRNARTSGAGYFSRMLKPSRALFLDMEAKTGLPFYSIFRDLETQTVARQNFLAAWADGRGEPLPAGTKPLAEIKSLLGKDDPHVVTAWLEAADKDAIAATMTPKQLQAAQALRQWYDGLFKSFGIQADYVENYAPRIRELATRMNNNDIRDIWARMYQVPMPSSVEFFADMARTGHLDIYETDALKAAAQYLKAGSSNRFMGPALDKATEFMRQVGDQRMVKPLGNMLEAMRGFEFLDHKIALSNSISDFLTSMGVSKTDANSLGNQLYNNAIGMGYTATLPFRLPSTLRNYFQVFQTTWPMTGMSSGRFAESIGRAMTKEGLLEAVKDNALSIETELQRIESATLVNQIPFFEKAQAAGFALYDSADKFTRVSTYWVFRTQAEDAIGEYAKAVNAGRDLGKARTALLSASGATWFDKPIQQEFLRRLASGDLERAAGYLGKEAADITQFIYGRGMQSEFLRSVPGRLFGQYGSWPLWYADYAKRAIWTNGIKAGNYGNAARFVARQAILAGALMGTSKALQIDLSRWYGHPAVFWGGGPGFQIAVGAGKMMSGLGSIVSPDGVQPTGDTSFQEGLGDILSSGKAFIPFYGAVMDMTRYLTTGQEFLKGYPGSGTQFLGALIGGRPTNEFYVNQILNAVGAEKPAGAVEFLRYKSPPTAIEQAQSLLPIYAPPPQSGQASGGPAPLPNAPAGAAQRIAGPSPLRVPPTPRGVNQIPESRPAEAHPIKNY